MTTTEARVAIVTGAGSGLGRAFVRELVAAGLRVAALGRTRSALDKTLLQLADDQAMAVVADVTDETQVAAAFDAVVQRWGRIDVLVNNAGVLGPMCTIDELPIDALRATLDANVVGSAICAAAAWRVMRSQHPSGGRIINNGSVSAQVPRPHSIAYAASKHAITGLTRSLALDGRPFGISCGQIDIGNARTAMTGSVLADALQADGTRAAEDTFDAQEAARAVVFMATLPAEATVLSVTIAATTMPLVGRG